MKEVCLAGLAHVKYGVVKTKQYETYILEINQRTGPHMSTSSHSVKKVWKWDEKGRKTYLDGAESLVCKSCMRQ